MPANEIKINGVAVYEVPDSFMGPIESYLKMVQEKTGQVLEEVPESRKNPGNGLTSFPFRMIHSFREY